MLKKIILILVFAAVSALATLRYIDQARKANPSAETAAATSIVKLYDLNDRLTEQAKELAPNGDGNYDDIADISYQLSEEFSGLRFETMIEAAEAYPSLADALDALDEKIGERSDLIDQYGGAETEEQSELVEQIAAADNVELLESVGSEFEGYNQIIATEVKNAKLLTLGALAALGLSLLWLMISALKSEKSLRTIEIAHVKKLAQKQEELNIAESLFSEQKKLSEHSDELSAEMKDAFNGLEDAQQYLQQIKASLTQHSQLDEKLNQLNLALNSDERDKKAITRLMIEAVETHRDLQANSSDEAVEVLTAQLNQLQNTFNDVLDSKSSRPVIETI